MKRSAAQDVEDVADRQQREPFAFGDRDGRVVPLALKSRDRAVLALSDLDVEPGVLQLRDGALARADLCGYVTDPTTELEAAEASKTRKARAT